jgi:hypothetical protein
MASIFLKHQSTFNLYLEPVSGFIGRASLGRRQRLSVLCGDMFVLVVLFIHESGLSNMSLIVVSSSHNQAKFQG